MNLEINNKLYGEYRITVYRKEDLDDRGNPLSEAYPRIDTGFVPNLLTDFFFDQFCSGVQSQSGLTQYIQCGTGTSPAANTDTSITPIGPRAALHSRAYSAVSNELTCTSEYRFAQGAIVGTVSEVGIFQNSSGGSTCMRSLIKDTGGTPTTITLTSIDYLYITWRVKSTVSLSDTTGTLTIAGTSYNYTLRPSSWNAPNLTSSSNMFQPMNALILQAVANTGFIGVSVYGSQTLGGVTSTPSSSEGSASLSPLMPTYATYVSGSKSRKVTWFIADSQANFAGGIGSIAIQPFIGTYGGGYQISFAAVSGGGKIPKDNTKTLTFSLTFTWSR